MAGQILQPMPSGPWEAAARQHDVISRAQLLALGLTGKAIDHRLRTGRLHPMWEGIYAVGRPRVSRLGVWKAATLSCGLESAITGESGAALWGVRSNEGPLIEVSVPLSVVRSRPGIKVRRRADLGSFMTEVEGIPVATVPFVLVELAGRLGRDSVEAAVNQADKLDLIHPESLRESLEELAGRRGVAALRRILDRHTFQLSDSALERRFRPIARRAGLPEPEMGEWVNGFEVDFYWPALGLVVETDGLRYHRTPAQQARAYVRDQTHVRAGLLPLRFSHAQIAFEARYVEETIADSAAQLRAARRSIEGSASP